ncbi:nucleotide sugar dehydrogenase [Mesotoga sp.]|uniref:nucleotide sugar dehydrogenase n=1 Tax=Mesotoga sp. TaxID=2053577 RepID=UPI001BD52ECF|nr:nucleotide sugar dehydrogenase [Mesotoga sp.]
MTEENILNASANVGIIGMGYVGLPLAVEVAKAGFDVRGFEISAERVKMLNNGENYIGDVDNNELRSLARDGRLLATVDFEGISNCDIVIVCVPTPLDVFKQPDLSYIVNASREISKYMKSGTLVVLESTTFPGTTEDIMKPILEETGTICGEDFFLAFSPERVDPGNQSFKTGNTPKVVGGCGVKSTSLAKAFYEKVLHAPIFVVNSPREAEMTKILENTFRIVNIALANEMAIVAERMGINIWEVIDAASTKPFGFMPFYPGPGVGGHCIPIDPFYLTYIARKYDYHTRLIELAGEINNSMPEYVVERLMKLLNAQKKCLNGSKIVLIGLAYKNDISDLRESPALDVLRILEENGALVNIVDPYIQHFDWHGTKRETSELTNDLLSKSDAVVITTAHMKNIDYDLIVDKAPLVLDTRSILRKLGLEERENVSLL